MSSHKRDHEEGRLLTLHEDPKEYARYFMDVFETHALSCFLLTSGLLRLPK